MNNSYKHSAKIAALTDSATKLKRLDVVMVE